MFQLFGYFFLWIGVSIFTLFALIAGIATVLPIAASSNQFQTYTERKASEFFERPVRVGRIAWTYSDGLLIKDVRILDRSPYSSRPMLLIDRIGVWAGGFMNEKPAVRFECVIDGMIVRLIRNPDGTTNLENLLSVFQKPETPPEKEKKSGKPFNIHAVSAKTPVDLTFRFHLNNFSCIVADRMNGRRLLADDLHFHFNIPSLLTKGIQVETSASLEINDRKIPPARFTANLDRMFDSGGTMTLFKAAGRVKTAFPGLRFDLSADMADAEIRSNMHIDFPVLTSLAKPFLPKQFAEAEFKGTCDIQTVVNDFPDRKGRFDINGVSLALNGAFPGVGLKIQGDMKQQGVKSDIRIDLNELKNFAGPILPPEAADMQVQGELGLLADAFRKSDFQTAFDIRIKGGRINAGGGILEQKSIGPISFRLFNQGDLNLKSGKLNIHKGGFEFLETSSMTWKGEAEDIKTANPMIRFTVGPVKLVLSEITPVFTDFLPASLSLPEKETPSELNIREILVNGKFPAGRGVIEMTGLEIRLPEFGQQTETGGAALVRNILISPVHVNIGLLDMAPERLSFSAGASIGSIDIKGDSPVTVKDFKISELLVRSENIKLDEKAPLKAVSDFQIDESINIGRLSLPSDVTLSNIYQSATVGISLAKKRPGDIKIGSFRIGVPGISIKHPTFGGVDTNAEIKGHVKNIRITALDPPAADISDAALRLVIGDMIKVVMNADAEQSAEKSLKSHGTAFVSLSEINRVFKSKTKPDSDMKGAAEIGWRFSGRAPAKKELDLLQAANPAPNIDSALDFIDNALVTLNLNDIHINTALGDEGRVKCGPIRTKSPLSYEFSGKTGKGKLNLNLSVGGVEELPSLRFDPPVIAEFSVLADHDGLKSANVKQQFDSESIKIHETLDIFVHGVDKALKKSLTPNIETLANHIGAVISAQAEINDAAALSTIAPGIQMDGSMSANLGFTLKPGQSAQTHVNIQMKDFSADLKDGARIKNLTTDIDLEKTYLIRSGDRDAPGASAGKRTPLSVEVLKMDTKSISGDSADGLQGDSSRIRNRFDTIHSIVFDAAQMEGGPVPLQFGPSMVNFRLNNGLPQLNPFQAEILGGTINGGLAILKSNSTFFLKAGLMFSGLDMRKLFPGGTAGAGPDADTEVGGRISLLLPLMTEIEPLIRDLNLELQFSHIGSKALEWLLYSLDPSESNETIVSQRKLVRNGSPKHIHVTINDGGFSLNGKVMVKGVSVSIPPIDRLNIGALPGIGEYNRRLEALKPIINALQKSSSGVIFISDDGSILFQN